MKTETQDCPRCKRTLPAEAYSPSQWGTKGRWCRQCNAEARRGRRKNGVTPKEVRICQHCGASMEGRPHRKWCSTSCSAAAWREANPGMHRRYSMKHTYGLEYEAYEAMIVAQEGKCTICLREFSEELRICVDHDHDDGRVRGLLCDDCNNGLGRFHDDPEALRRAADYLSPSSS